MFNIAYLGSDVLLVLLNILLIRRMHFENIAWPVIAVAVLASIYIMLIDFTLYYNWFGISSEFLFSHRVGIYKSMIVTGLVLSLIRIPVVRIMNRVTKRTNKERLGGRESR